MNLVTLHIHFCNGNITYLLELLHCCQLGHKQVEILTLGYFRLHLQLSYSTLVTMYKNEPNLINLHSNTTNF